MSSAVAKPDSIIRIAESRYGISSALTMNPARSWLRITCLSRTFGGEVVGAGDRLRRRQQAGDQLDEPQHRHRVEEVDADHLLGPAGGDAELHDRDRDGVAGQDRRRVGDDLVERREHVDLAASSSTTASTTSWRSARSPRSVVNVIRPSAASRSSSRQLAASRTARSSDFAQPGLPGLGGGRVDLAHDDVEARPGRTPRRCPSPSGRSRPRPHAGGSPARPSSLIGRQRSCRPALGRRSDGDAP